MLEILMSFISDMTQKFIETKIVKNKNATGFLKNLIKITITYGELAECLENFQQAWSKWIDNNYDGNPQYMDSSYNITKKILRLIDDYEEIKSFLIFEDPDLAKNMRWWAVHKLSIFDAWRFIASNRPVYDYSSMDKMIYIPNYSLILPNVKSISDCDEEELKLCRKIASESYDISYYLYRGIVNKDMSKYIPALLPENCRYLNKSFVLELHIPDDIAYVNEFLAVTSNAVLELKKYMEQCKDIVLKYTSEENMNLLNIIVLASKNIDK